MKVNKVIIKAILEFYKYNLETHCQQPPREEKMKKRIIKKKVNKKSRRSQEDEEQMEDELNQEPAVEEEQEQENEDNLDNLIYEEWRRNDNVVEQEVVDKEPVDQEVVDKEPVDQEFVDQEQEIGEQEFLDQEQELGEQEFVAQEPGEQDARAIPKRKKRSPVTAIRMSQRVRKRPSSHMNFVDFVDSDDDREDVSRRKTKKPKTAMRSLTPQPKGDYEKARDCNVAQKEKLYGDLNFSEELDKIAEEMDL